MGLPASVVGRMSAWELTEWAVFEREFGPLTIHQRIDAAIQRIAYTVHASAGGESPPEAFRPEWRQQRAWSGDQMMMWLDAEAKRAY